MINSQMYSVYNYLLGLYGSKMEPYGLQRVPSLMCPYSEFGERVLQI